MMKKHIKCKNGAELSKEFWEIEKRIGAPKIMNNNQNLLLFQST